MDYDYEIEKKYHPENFKENWDLEREASASMPNQKFLNAILDCGTIDTIEEMELEDDEQDEEEN